MEELLCLGEWLGRRPPPNLHCNPGLLILAAALMPRSRDFHLLLVAVLCRLCRFRRGTLLAPLVPLMLPLVAAI